MKVLGFVAAATTVIFGFQQAHHARYLRERAVLMRDAPNEPAAPRKSKMRLLIESGRRAARKLTHGTGIEARAR